ncbi:MAG: AtpZ/AtpI family protein [Deltaproteobacteria bacterium]|nr:AtpZ/AtpI family protein [Deltaproteobacteria bacterium]
MDPEAKKMWQTAASHGALGLEIAAAVGIGYFGGQYLDRMLGVSPWLTWIGFAAGVGASAKAMIRVVRNYNKSLEPEPPPDKDE